MNVHPDLADYAVGASVTLKCLNDNTLFGEEKVSCLTGGDWSDTPYCGKTGKVLDSCYKPGHIIC